MLIYVATYPRCGSSMLRSTLRMNFGLLTANGQVMTLAAEPSEDPDLSWATDPMFDCVPRQLVVSEPSTPRLNVEVRRRLAALPQPLFVKTHELPYSEWLPGEQAIQMVRHPGAAMTSFYRLKQPRMPGVSLEQFVMRPDWAAYHEQWLASELPTLRLRYEDMFDSPGLRLALSAFLRRPWINTDISTLAEAVGRNPARNPGRGIDGWRQEMSPEAYATLCRVNADTAAKLGYHLTDAPAPRTDR